MASKTPRCRNLIPPETPRPFPHDERRYWLETMHDFLVLRWLSPSILPSLDAKRLVRGAVQTAVAEDAGLVDIIDTIT